MAIKLTLLLLAAPLIFAQTAASPAAMPQNPALPTIWVVGDSTANNADHRGWGDPLASYFEPAKVNVVNRARAGRSSRTFYTEGLWDRVREQLKPGDYVLIEFGHNDGGAFDKPPYRGSLPGLGEEAQEFTKADGSHETVHTFGWYNRKFIEDSKTADAHPILLSPTVRNIWTGNYVERAMGHFGQWDVEIAKAEGIPFIDHTNAIADVYEKIGPEKVKALFPQDHTHTSPEGADLNASLVVGGLKGIRSPLVAFLSAKGQFIQPYPLQGAPNIGRLNLPYPNDPKLPTLFLIGDSTVRNGHGDGAGGQWGWGEPIVDYFDPAKINVVNRAVGGLSSRTFIAQTFWDRVLAIMKPGDYVIMQFGHNDGGPLSDPARARGTLPGIGDETKEIDNPITKQHEVVHTYGWYLKKYVAETRAKGATPMICSLIPRKIWKDGKVVRNTDGYAGWARQIAEESKAPFIDLNTLIADRYDALGPEKVEPLFADPHTHTSRAGAEVNAECVIQGLKALPDDPLAKYFSAKGEAVPRP
jgi:lysophospholipase L1-like esterase